MGPPDAAAPRLKPGVEGDAMGELAADAVPRGRVSKDRARRHAARTREKDAGTTGSWVDVYSSQCVWPFVREVELALDPEVVDVTVPDLWCVGARRGSSSSSVSVDVEVRGCASPL